MRKNWLIFAGVAVATYVIALPGVAPASVSDAYSLSYCDSWTRQDNTIWDCPARNTYPDFYVGDYSKAYFDLVHKPGKTVHMAIVRTSYSGSVVSDSKNVVLSSGSSPVFKEYSVTPSEVLVMPSRWDYVYLYMSGAEELIGTTVVVD